MDDFNLRSNLEEEAPLFLPDSLGELRDHIQRLRDEIMASLPADQLDHSQIQNLVEDLPRLTEQELTDLGHKDSLCPICLTPYLAILAEEEMALAMDSPAHPVEELGITRLSNPWQCGHVFCRRDISKWIREAHDSCPLCRRLLVKPETTTQAPRPENDAAPASPVELDALERQIGFHIDLLRSQINHVRSPESRTGRTAQPHIEEEDSRSAFSGMYS
ncbi:putative ring finger protein [Lyophyllum shimeji]|uniref:Ring finger protein n=1 Tax=Lyophyllum shimeji TaxID=47721 RepID=A0A9P3PD43_LYOSH|nr:putative ring finger protein [Lyophyllum shimeji]